MNGLLTGPRSQAAHSWPSVENQGDPGSSRAVTSLIQLRKTPAITSVLNVTGTISVEQCVPAAH